MRVARWLTLLFAGSVLATAVPQASSQSILDKLKAKAKAKIDQKEDNAAGAAVNAADPTASHPSARTPTPPPSPAAPGTSPAAPAATAASAVDVPATIRAYQNYDFVPGETILFADDFTNTPDGEFPEQWEMDKGQATVNKEG